MTAYAHLRLSFAVFTTLLLLPNAGCSQSAGPELGEVEGVVTIDGQPVESTTVTFRPPAGRKSRGYTDAEGRYSLIYLRDIRGALVGPHTVSIQFTAEQVAEATNAKGGNPTTKWSRQVSPGVNRFDFELLSEAESK
jgi:hypothetical protein